MLTIQKLLTALALPAGLLWLGLLALTLLAWGARARRTAILALAMWLVLGIAGNAWTGALLARWLEAPFVHVDPFNESARADAPAYDALVVLGGGIGANPRGDPQLRAGGDRVMLAARLYHAYRTATLIATGARRHEPDGDPGDQAHLAARMWRDLGVPEAAIHRLAGRTTSEEMARLNQWLSDRPQQRVGLVTSAWHMPRALRLAEGEGLELEPVPADFEGVIEPFAIDRLVPSSSGLDRTQVMLRELLARLAGR